MPAACVDLDNVRPVANIALPVGVISHGDHGAIGFKPQRVPAACVDLDNVRPVANITLPVGVISHGDHGAVELKPHRVPIACGDLDDVRPAADITLPRDVPSHSDYGAVGLKPNCVPGTCGDLENFCPAADIALPEGVPSHSDHGAVGLKPHCVPIACGEFILLGKAGCYTVGAVHRDLGCGGIDIVNRAYVTSPVVKVIARIGSRLQVDHRSHSIGKTPLSRGDYRPSSGTGDSEGMRSRLSTAYHPGNEGYHNQKDANSCHVMVFPQTKYYLHFSPLDSCSCLIQRNRVLLLLPTIWQTSAVL